MAYRTKTPARGTKDHRSPGVMQLVIRLDDDTFAEIRGRAVAENTSVAEQIRLLVEWGLETAKQDVRN